MDKSERCNLPRWEGQDGFYEIWFFVVFDRDRKQAYWFRYTTYAPAPGKDEDRRATLWAAVFDEDARPRARAIKTIFDEDDYDGGDQKRFHVRIGSADIGHGFCRGEVIADAPSSVDSIGWEFHFRPGQVPEQRTPRLLTSLPLGVHAHHVHTEIEIDGWVSIDGRRRELAGGRGIQMHIYGTRRVEELYWIYAPHFEQEYGETDRTEGSAAVEVVSARLTRTIRNRQTPRLTSIWMSDERALQRTGLTESLRSSLTCPTPGVLQAVSSRPQGLIRVRSYAPMDTFVGYRYRDPSSGEDLSIAQSDLATVFIETFERRGLGKTLTPRRQLICSGRAALEFHSPEPELPIAYIDWDHVSLAPSTHRPKAPLGTDRPAPAPSVGTLRDLPLPKNVFALGLTYLTHAAEIGALGTSRGKVTVPKAEVFRKDPSTWLSTDTTVNLPSSAELLAALEALEPGLAREVSSHLPFLPALLDYEVELGMMLLEDVEETKLARGGALPEVGYFVANDLGSRSIQALGEGQPHPMAYWGVSKSFPGFLPVGPHLWVPPPDARDRWPALTLRTRVNGQVRQEDRTTSLSLSPRDVLLQVMAASRRDLHPGDVILTGTPAGAAQRTPTWKRALAKRLWGRMERLRRLLAAYPDNPHYLLPGDVVEVDAEFLGRRTIQIAVR